MKSETTKSKTVYFTPDPANPPRMTPAEKARFDAMTDDDIDYSDIPDTSGTTGWTRPGATANEMARRKSDVKKHLAAQANGAGKRKSHAR